MRRNDHIFIFEKFPDGSALWRGCIAGRFEAQRKMDELAEHSQNEFFLIDVKAGQHRPFNLTRANPRRTLKIVAAGSRG